MFHAAGDFTNPVARHELIQFEKKKVDRELEECLKTKQQVLHKTLKIFLKIQTHDNKKLALSAKRQARAENELNNVDDAANKTSPRFNSSSPVAKREHIVVNEEHVQEFERQEQ